MSQELSGKVAIITGGASGIGEGTAELFVQEGARIVIADVNEARGQEVAARLGPAARFMRTDVSIRDDIQAVVDFAVSEFGGLHIMFNNAGIAETPRLFMDDDLPNFDRILKTNLVGVLLGTQIAARHMIKAGGGSIINTSSLAGLSPGPGHTSYRAAKVGIVGFTQSVAIELGRHLVRVNCICPGNIVSNIGTYAAPGPGIPEEALERMRDTIKAARMKMQPLQRQGTATDIGQAAVFLGSDRSQYVTGVILPVDGGLAAGFVSNYNIPEVIAEAKAEALAQAQPAN
jgi:NAD(P)-dependent dehydrogenase (short-subunit alcohol dehydrogenase family)